MVKFKTGMLSRAYAFERIMLVFLATLIIGEFIWRLRNAQFDQSYGFPPMPVRGDDFGWAYRWASALRHGFEEYFSLPNGWPPAATIILMPFTLVSQNTAYCI